MATETWCGGEPPAGAISSDGRWWREGTDPSRKVFALAPLSFYPPGHSFAFAVGDELQDVLPADVLAACVERGEAGLTRPKIGSAEVPRG